MSLPRISTSVSSLAVVLFASVAVLATAPSANAVDLSTNCREALTQDLQGVQELYNEEVSTAQVIATAEKNRAVAGVQETLADINTRKTAAKAEWDNTLTQFNNGLLPTSQLQQNRITWLSLLKGFATEKRTAVKSSNELVALAEKHLKENLKTAKANRKAGRVQAREEYHSCRAA